MNELVINENRRLTDDTCAGCGCQHDNNVRIYLYKFERQQKLQ